MAVTIPMLRSQCKVLNRWNGSSNDAPPTGWDAVSFDDSAWPDASSFTPTQSLSGGTNGRAYQNGSSVALTGFASPIANGAEAIAPWTVPPSSTASFLIRWRFTGLVMPSDTIIRMYEDIFAAGFGANTGTTTINDNNANMFGAINNLIQQGFIVAGANVWAFAPQCNWNGTPDAGWYTMALTSATATFPTPKHAQMVSIVG